MLENIDDINHYIQDNINQKLPKDGPLWRVYIQNYTENGIEGSLVLWKAHHSFCDGASSMSMTLAMSEEYDRSYFVKGDDLPMWQRIITRIAVPF